MRFISTPVHAMMDYLTGALLTMLPFLFGFATGGLKQWLPIALGIILLLQGLMTRYELGLMPVISLPIHLGLDILSGLLLVASPWVFGFADQVFWPHLILGLIEIGTACCTETRSTLPRRAARAQS